MLWQLHHQFKDGHTVFISQIELADDDDPFVVVSKAVREAWETNPPPKGAQFVIGNEEWEYFVQKVDSKGDGNEADSRNI